MSRLLEYRGKKLLREKGFNVPKGILITCTNDIEKAFLKIGQGVLKAQAFTTGRIGKGLIKFPQTLNELYYHTEELFKCTVNGSPVKELLYEEKLSIEKEFYAGIIVDKSICAPVLLFSSMGGSGIEDISKRYPASVFKYPITIDKLPLENMLIALIEKTGVEKKLLKPLANVIGLLVKTALESEAENLEINPLILTKKGELVAADCHLTVDDYAVFRHPEYEIEIPRELGHSPTGLEKIAWNAERNDYRGTFYFIQLEDGFNKGEGFVGFHGAGGGGSMMSMDALQRLGYKPANFCDTSGNPPASKIYRAARIIMAQKNIDGYFGSGSGVASQEQFHSARGIVKALREENPDFPVVLRLGGNGEEEAIRILESYTKTLKATVKCFGKDTSVNECAAFFDKLVKDKQAHKASDDNAGFSADSSSLHLKTENGDNFNATYSFSTISGGTVSFDYSRCAKCSNRVCISGCYAGILKEENGLPVLNIPMTEAAKGKCIECLVCEVECSMYGNNGGRIILPIKGIDGDLT